jgi:hypothetical protein
MERCEARKTSQKLRKSGDRKGKEIKINYNKPQSSSKLFDPNSYVF